MEESMSTILYSGKYFTTQPHRAALVFVALCSLLRPATAEAQVSLPLYAVSNLGFGAAALAWSVAAEPSPPRITVALPPGPAHAHHASADQASEALLFATVLGAGLSPLVSGFSERAGMAAVDIAQATLLAYAAKTHLKRLFPRLRPYAATLASSGPAEEREQSFPSGHATIVWAAVSSAAVHTVFDRQAAQWTSVVAVGTAATAAVVTSVLRVVSGSHYLGDVIAGAAVGCAVGAAVVLLNGGGAPYSANR